MVLAFCSSSSSYSPTMKLLSLPMVTMNERLLSLPIGTMVTMNEGLLSLPIGTMVTMNEGLLSLPIGTMVTMNEGLLSMSMMPMMMGFQLALQNHQGMQPAYNPHHKHIEHCLKLKDKYYHWRQFYLLPQLLRHLNAKFCTKMSDLCYLKNLI